MGYDKLTGFFTKSLSNKIFDEVIINKYSPNYVTQHLCIDINFIIFKCIYLIEDDVNNILKLINAREFNDNNTINKKMRNILKQKHWNINTLFNNYDEFYLFLENNINNILYHKILLYLSSNIHSIYAVDFIKSINIFFDGIPSFAKIIEQRKRRVNNYKESLFRKEQYKKYYKHINKYIYYEDGYFYDYIYYVNNMYSFNKSIGPCSPILINMVDYFNKNIKLYFPKQKIYINDSCIYGEADFKIIKFIEKIKGDVTIISCDSDFLFYVILFQQKNNLEQRNNTYKYLRLVDNYIHLFDGNNIIDLLLQKYNKVNYSINNNLVINDFLLSIMMFGNDIIPFNYELNSELNMELIFKCLYKIHKNNNYIITINSKKIINYYHLKIFLNELKNSNTFNIIYFNKVYKINNVFSNILLEKLKLNEYDIKNKILKPYLSYQGSILKNLDTDDIRYIFYKEMDNKINPIDTLKISTSDKKMLNVTLLNCFNYINIEDYGLIKLKKKVNIESNSLNNTYNFITLNTSCKHNIYNYSEYKKESNKCNVNNYLNLIEYYANLYFNDINIHSPENNIYYKYDLAPNLDNIIKYLNNNKYIKFNPIEKIEPYFNQHTHLLFITPYLLNSSYIKHFNNIKHIKKILEIIQYNIKNIWDLDNIYCEPNKYLFYANKLIMLFNNYNIENLYNSKLLLI